MLQLKLPSKERACCVMFVLLLILLLPIAYTTKLRKSSLIYNRINPNLLIHDQQVNGDALNKITMHQKNKIPNHHNSYNKSGHGIVYTGNVQLFHLIYISISVLEYMDFTSYPIEIFVNGVDNDKDMKQCNSTFTNSFANTFNIKCVYINDNNAQVSSRFSYKILALLRSSFQHILFLDDDNIIIQSPEILFHSIEYKSNLAIFWTDFWGKNCDGLFQGGYILYEACLESNGIYDTLDKTYIKYDTNNLKYTQSQEAAQLAIDTVTYYDTLTAVLHCTEGINGFQQHLHGDKDCFRFMFLERNNSFYYTPIMPQYVGFTRIDDKGDSYFYRHALLQFWGNKENVLFIHQTKWIEPMDHRLWEYYQEMIVDWTCAVENGQDHIFPFPRDEKYLIIETQTGKANGKLIHELEQKWEEFWHKYDSIV